VIIPRKKERNGAPRYGQARQGKAKDGNAKQSENLKDRKGLHTYILLPVGVGKLVIIDECKAVKGLRWGVWGEKEAGREHSIEWKWNGVVFLYSPFVFSMCIAV